LGYRVSGDWVIGELAAELSVNGVSLDARARGRLTVKSRACADLR
jgi:hypothetical protein